MHTPRGRVGRYKPSRDPDRHAKDDNQYTNHAQISSHSGSPYVHATGITNLNTSISMNTQLLTSMNLISHLHVVKLLQGIKHIIFTELQVLCRIL